MFKKILYTVFGVVFLTAYSLGIFRLGIYMEKRSQVQQNQVEASEEKPKYLVKEYEGVICVFVDGDEAPQRTLDINVNGLRQYDRERFKEGIPLNSLDELAQLEEDFSGI